MRGIALVVISLFLSLLLLLATGFLYASRSSHAVARCRVDGVRAALLARSGTEYASARLTADPDPRPGATRAAARDDWTCRDGLTVRLEAAHNPSYAHGEPYVDGGVSNGRYDRPPSSDAFDPTLHERNGDGVHTGWTGRLRGTAQVEGDTFSLKIALEEGKLYVNGGYLDGGDRADPVANTVPDHRDAAAGYNAVLCRILNRLGTHPQVNVPNLGDRVIAARPRGGYASLGDLYGLAGVAGADLSAYLTCRSWVDTSVIRPNVDAAHMEVPVDSPAQIKVQRGGAPRPEPAGRAPVNVNVAEAPLLEALLVDLSGATQARGGIWTTPPLSPPYWSRLRQVAVPPIPPAAAAEVARRIVEVRAGREDANRNGFLDPGEDADGDGLLDSPFRTWGQFAAFCDTLATTGVLSPAAAGDVVLANANPNSDLNENIPDRILWREVDKSDLLVHSTEFSLHPMAGFFSVESLGITRDVRGGPAATARIFTESRMFLPLRHTTQADFVAGRAVPAEYTSPAVHAGVAPSFRTHGAARGWGGSPGIGLSLATLPEPVPALAAGRAAVYDGQVCLATVELPSDPGPDGATFVHRFTDGWAPDLGVDGAPDVWLPVYGRQCSAELQADPGASCWDAVRPGTLYPDGVHAQTWRVRMYASEGNLHPSHGVVSYWVKEGVAPSDFRYHVCVNGVQRDSDTQSHFLCTGGMDTGWYGLLVEDSAATGDRRHERGPYRSDFVPSTADRRWVLMTAGWDLADTSGTGQPWCRLDGRVRRTVMDIERYPDTLGGVFSPLAGPSRRILIGGSPAASYWGSHGGVNAVIDEVCIFDYGPGGLAARGQSDPMSQERFRDGRYYKRNDGMFTSVDLRAALPAGALTLERVYRTEILPRQPVEVPLDPDLADARLRLEVLAGPSGSQTVVYDSDVSPPLDYGSSSDARHAATGTGPLRYRVTFLPTPNWDPTWILDRPVLETPYLDDVTLLVRPPGYPLRLRWVE